MRKLTVLYDSGCAFCRRCRQWLEGQAQLMPLELLPQGGAVARARYPSLSAAVEELIVVSDEGEVWRGDEAFVVCLWALEDYRTWSVRLASPTLRPLARRAFEWISAHRGGLSRLFASGDAEAVRMLEKRPEPSCAIDDGSPRCP